MKVFFDVDGVLIDGWHHNPARRRRWDATLQADFGVGPDAFSKALFGTPGDGYPRRILACIKGDRELGDVLAEVLPPLGYTGPVDAFIDYWFAKDSRINQGVLDVARALAAHDHVAVYLATGQEHRRAHHLWHGLGFKDYFREMFYSARLGELKTERGFYDKVNEALGVEDGERPLFFDDSPGVVASADAAGWDAWLFETVDDVRGHPRLQGLL